ncbi:hypothetical protein CSUI_006214 [Cystoisospora suis]|uniref:Uncharacterized protein n=1 Tax=Cystoisospora suis TaxID=483139 RepID=A0A2C6KR40_9APIC|nr:hypothetical protein CSUI_006214 [Cystoisospora suis]
MATPVLPRSKEDGVTNRLEESMNISETFAITAQHRREEHGRRPREGTWQKVQAPPSLPMMPLGVALSLPCESFRILGSLDRKSHREAEGFSKETTDVSWWLTDKSATCGRRGGRQEREFLVAGGSEPQLCWTGTSFLLVQGQEGSAILPLRTRSPRLVPCPTARSRLAQTYLTVT